MLVFQLYLFRHVCVRSNYLIPRNYPIMCCVFVATERINRNLVNLFDRCAPQVRSWNLQVGSLPHFIDLLAKKNPKLMYF